MQKLVALLAGCWLAAVAQAASFADECAAPPPLPLSLPIAEERVARCNRDVRAALDALQMAAADRRIAGQRPNPTLTLGASNVNPHAGLGAGGLRDKTFDSSVHIEQLVERGGKGELRARQAEQLLIAARADVAEQLRLQRLAMRGAFFDLGAAQDRVRVQRDFLSLSSESVNAATRRFEAGEVSRAEANRFRLDAARVANDLRQSLADLQRIRLDLAKLIGAESSAPALEVAIAGVAPAQGMFSAAAAADGLRPDVAAARHRFEAAEAARELARSLATRDVTVGVQADRWPASEANLQGTGVSYGLSVSVPLHVRHANEGEAARALADRDAARNMVERLEAQSAAERRLAEEDARAALERRARFEKEIGPAARDVAQSAQLAYSRGATGVLDLLDARRSLKAVELDELQARTDAAKAWARLEAANETWREGMP
jgi:cobalt-zinc-cadmium efflux system outer membrane protein